MQSMGWQDGSAGNSAKPDHLPQIPRVCTWQKEIPETLSSDLHTRCVLLTVPLPQWDTMTEKLTQVGEGSVQGLGHHHHDLGAWLQTQKGEDGAGELI